MHLTNEEKEEFCMTSNKIQIRQFMCIQEYLLNIIVNFHKLTKQKNSKINPCHSFHWPPLRGESLWAISRTHLIRRQ